MQHEHRRHPVAQPNGKVLRFPTERITREPRPLVVAWYRCAGGCGALVTSAHAYCLRCAVEDR